MLKVAAGEVLEVTPVHRSGDIAGVEGVHGVAGH
jgi:hypothetical protein